MAKSCSGFPEHFLASERAPSPLARQIELAARPGKLANRDRFH